MSWIEALLLAYALTGGVKVLINIPYLKLAWQQFDVEADENLSLWEKRNITENQYYTAKYMVFALVVLFTWLMWPLPNREDND